LKGVDPVFQKRDLLNIKRSGFHGEGFPETGGCGIDL